MNIPATVITAVLCFGITALLGFVAIPALRKLKFGQTILDIGPAWHKSKNGTPTMGGVMFIAGVVISFAAGVAIMWASGAINMDDVGSQKLAKAISAVVMALMFGFVGFVDDLIKVKKKQNEGLKPMQKIIMQVLIIAAFFTSHVIAGDTSTVINFPFLGQVDFGIFYYIVMGLGILYLVNAVNLTDGIDGLCSSVTLVYCGAYVLICSLVGMGLSWLYGVESSSCEGNDGRHRLNVLRRYSYRCRNRHGNGIRNGHLLCSVYLGSTFGYDTDDLL